MSFAKRQGFQFLPPSNEPEPEPTLEESSIAEPFTSPAPVDQPFAEPQSAESTSQPGEGEVDDARSNDAFLDNNTEQSPNPPMESIASADAPLATANALETTAKAVITLSAAHYLLTPYGIQFRTGITESEFQTLEIEVARLNNAAAYAIGDLLVARGKHYGETYELAQKVFSRSAKTLQAYKTVCERLEMSRRPDISFSLVQTVVMRRGFPRHQNSGPAAQEALELWREETGELFEQVEREQLSVMDVRTRLRSGHPTVSNPRRSVSRLIAALAKVDLSEISMDDLPKIEDATDRLTERIRELKLQVVSHEGGGFGEQEESAAPSPGTAKNRRAVRPTRCRSAEWRHQNPVITIAIPPRHPLTVTTENEPRYHFARLISVAGALLVIELRNLANLADLSVTGLILDTFVEVEEGTMAMISIQFDVRYVAADGDRIFRLQAVEPQRLRFTMPWHLP